MLINHEVDSYQLSLDEYFFARLDMKRNDIILKDSKFLPASLQDPDTSNSFWDVSRSKLNYIK